MKLLGIIFMMPLLSYAQNDVCDPWFENWTHKPDSDGLVEVLREDFNGTQLNKKRWDYCYPWGQVLETNDNDVSGCKPEQVTVNNGVLEVLSGAISNTFQNIIFEGTPPYETRDINRSFTGGNIWSRYEFKLGYFETKYKYDYIDGQWPSFWMLGDCAQEIDWFEYWVDWDGPGHDKDNARNIRYTVHQNVFCDGEGSCRKGFLVDKNSSGVWNISAGYWGYSKVEFYYNNNLDRRFTRHWATDGRQLDNPENGLHLRDPTFPYHHYPMRLYIGQGVHESATHGLLHVPKKLRVDNVIVKKDMYCDSTIIACNAIKQELMYDGFLVVGQIVLSDISNGCDLKVVNGEYLHAVASEFVDITPGFDAGEGSDFEAHVVACPSPYNKTESENGNQASTILKSYNENKTVVRIEQYDVLGKVLFQESDLNIKYFSIEDHLKTIPLRKGVNIFLLHCADGTYVTKKMFKL
jgi:hypothetical protein